MWVCAWLMHRQMNLIGDTSSHRTLQEKYLKKEEKGRETRSSVLTRQCTTQTMIENYYIQHKCLIYARWLTQEDHSLSAHKTKNGSTKRKRIKTKHIEDDTQNYYHWSGKFNGENLSTNFSLLANDSLITWSSCHFSYCQCQMKFM